MTGLLHERGAAIIDADRLARRAVEPGEPALAEIIRRFGVQYLDEVGRLRRRELGARVFRFPSELQALNAIVHPRIRALLAESLEALQRRPPQARIVVLEAALLLEAGWDELVDLVVTVKTQPRVRLSRLTADRGMEEDLARRLLRLQLSDSRRARRADVVLHGEVLEETTREAAALWERLQRELPARSRGSHGIRRTTTGP